jgi:hypothetical protein
MPRHARACPECGSDEQTGWSEESHSDGLALPEESFDYQDFVKREFESKGPVPRGVHWFWWAVAVALLVGLVVLGLR